MVYATRAVHHVDCENLDTTMVGRVSDEPSITYSRPTKDWKAGVPARSVLLTTRLLLVVIGRGMAKRRPMSSDDKQTDTET
jgi:hypothetical protein